MKQAIMMPTQKKQRRKRIIDHTKWYTNDEKIYIDGIGNGNSEYVETSRLELLMKYKESMRLRQHWCMVDPVKIQTHLEDAIMKEAKKQKKPGAVKTTRGW